MAGRFDNATVEAIVAVARREKLPPAALLAVVQVESGGRISARVRGRDEPLIRFEGHYFDRFLEGERLLRARAEGLADPKAGRVRNPRSQAARWDLLDRAVAIDRQAALSSVSWGVGQVMGSHWRWLGYGSVDALAAQARDGLAGQVALMVAYIDKAGLRSALEEGDFRRFARIYNGPAYARHGYHTKMERAHSHFERYLARAMPRAEADDRLKFGSRGPGVRRLQEALTRAGLPLAVDGIFGLVTDRAVRQFQIAEGLAQTGIADGATLSRLGAARLEDRLVPAVGRILSTPGRLGRRLQLSLRRRLA